MAKPVYYVYNIDLKSGDSLSYEEIYKLAGFNSENIDKKVETALTNELSNIYSDSVNPDYLPGGKEFNNYNNINIEIYKKSIKENTIKYFLDEDNQLNIIIPLKYGAELFGSDYIIIV